jgi:hypothetical protein
MDVHAADQQEPATETWKQSVLAAAGWKMVDGVLQVNPDGK